MLLAAHIEQMSQPETRRSASPRAFDSNWPADARVLLHSHFRFRSKVGLGRCSQYAEYSLHRMHHSHHSHHSYHLSLSSFLIAVMYSQEMRYNSEIGIAELKVNPSLVFGLFDEDRIVDVELRAHVELQRRSWFLAGRSCPCHYVVKLVEDMEIR